MHGDCVGRHHQWGSVGCIRHISPLFFASRVWLGERVLWHVLWGLWLTDCAHVDHMLHTVSHMLIPSTVAVCAACQTSRRRVSSCHVKTVFGGGGGGSRQGGGSFEHTTWLHALSRPAINIHVVSVILSKEGGVLSVCVAVHLSGPAAPQLVSGPEGTHLSTPCCESGVRQEVQSMPRTALNSGTSVFLHPNSRPA